MFNSILDWLSVHIVGLGWTESQSSPTVQKFCIQHQWLVLARSNSLPWCWTWIQIFCTAEHWQIPQCLCSESNSCKLEKHHTYDFHSPILLTSCSCPRKRCMQQDSAGFPAISETLLPELPYPGFPQIGTAASAGHLYHYQHPFSPDLLAMLNAVQISKDTSSWL